MADLGGEAPAGLRARAYAASCDFLIVIVVGFGVGKVVEIALSLAGFQVVSDALLWPMAFVVGWPYTVLLELHAGGRTIGRAAAGARLIREDGGDLTGALLSFRYLLKVVQIVVGSGLWFGAVAFDSRQVGRAASSASPQNPSTRRNRKNDRNDDARSASMRGITGAATT